jgi:hypothetical protein
VADRSWLLLDLVLAGLSQHRGDDTPARAFIEAVAVRADHKHVNRVLQFACAQLGGDGDDGEFLAGLDLALATVVAALAHAAVQDTCQCLDSPAGSSPQGDGQESIASSVTLVSALTALCEGLSARVHGWAALLKLLLRLLRSALSDVASPAATAQQRATVDVYTLALQRCQAVQPLEDEDEEREAAILAPVSALAALTLQQAVVQSLPAPAQTHLCDLADEEAPGETLTWHSTVCEAVLLSPALNEAPKAFSQLLDRLQTQACQGIVPPSLPSALATAARVSLQFPDHDWALPWATRVPP